MLEFTLSKEVKESKEGIADVRWCVTDRTRVNEEKVTIVVHHSVARMQVPVEGADAEHEGAVNSEQFQHVGPVE